MFIQNIFATIKHIKYDIKNKKHSFILNSIKAELLI